jgi:glycosyltransferase involved in cell wall biosynthesis
MQLLSVVIPVYCEEEVLPRLFERLAEVLGSLEGLALEVLLVDDGSSDGSWALIEAQHRHDPRFRGLRLSRNFGHQVALTAGLDHACGDAVVVMDADLQDPPEVVLELVQRWREGFPVVYGRRRSRAGEGWFKKLTAGLFYRLMQRLSADPTPRDVGDFYLLDRRALAQLCTMRERHRYLRGMVFWLGFERAEVRYDRQPRARGRTKYDLGRMLRFALDGALSSSSAPLTLASYVGLLSALLGLFLGVSAVWEKLTQTTAVVGWASTVVIVLFLGGVQLTTIGLLGLYVGRIYDEAKRRPLYLLDRVLGEPGGSEE